MRPRTRATQLAGYEVRAVLARPEGLLLRPLRSVLRRGKITHFGPSDTKGYDWHYRDRYASWNDLRHAELVARCPYGKAGDLIAVQETWAIEPGVHPGDASVLYRATDPGWDDNKTGLRWRSASQLTRDLSRITLRIKEVRPRLLKAAAASEWDVLTCGLERQDDDGTPMWLTAEGWPMMYADLAFRSHWDARYGKRLGLASLDNPWVWAIEVERVVAEKATEEETL